MKKIIFTLLFFAVLIFGIETFHNDTAKWGDFEAIYCYAQSVWTSTPVNETCAGTMNEKDTVQNGLPYSVLVIVLFKILNLLPYWLAAYLWVLAKAWAMTYIAYMICSKFPKLTIQLLLIIFLSFGGFFLSNTGQSVTLIMALMVCAIDNLNRGRYKAFAVFVLLSAIWKYYPAWALVLLLFKKEYRIFIISALIFTAYFFGQRLIYTSGTDMLFKFMWFYNHNAIVRYAVIAALFGSWYLCLKNGMREHMCNWIFIATITFMTIGHKNEYNLSWMVLPLAMLIAKPGFLLYLVMSYMVAMHAGFHIPADYHLYFIAWAVVAYVIAMPWTIVNKPEINTSPFKLIITPKTSVNKIAEQLIKEMNKKKWRA